MNSSNERGGVICRYPIDRHVERLDNLAIQISPQLSTNLAADFGSEWEGARRTQMSQRPRGPRTMLLPPLPHEGRGRPLVSIAPPASGGVPRRTLFFPRVR